MKGIKIIKVTTAIFILLLANFVDGQDSVLTKTKYQQFYSRAGKMFRTDHWEIGNSGSIDVNVYRTIDLETGDSSKAVYLNQSSGMMMGSASKSTNLFIDAEELVPMVKAFEYCLNQVRKGKGVNEPYFSFYTNADVGIECGYSEKGLGKGWDLIIAKRYHYLQTVQNYINVSVKEKYAENLLKLLKEAQNNIGAK